MTDWDRFWQSLNSNPIAQVLIMVLAFVVRVELDRWERRRRDKKERKPKAPAHG